MPRTPNIPKRKLPTPVKCAPQQNQVEPLIEKGLALHLQGYFNEAKAIYEKVLTIQANHFGALHLLGVLFAQTKQFTKAVDFLNKALQINPNHAACYSNRGIALKELQRLDEALASYDKAISIEPDYAEAYSNRGIALKILWRLDEALASYDKAIGIKPDYAEAYSNRGIVLQELQRLDEALASFDKAIGIKSDYAEAYYNRGNALQELQHLEEALASYDKAIGIKPDYAEAHYNRGNALLELQRLDEALASYDKAIGIKPNYVEAYSNRGNALQELQRLDEALASFDKAIGIKSDYAEAYYNRGNALQELQRFEEALASYDQAIGIKPDYVSAHWNLSLCNLLVGNFKDGWQGYEWRWKNEELSSYKNKRNFPQPLWVGAESLEDKTILLYAEQGLGDTIQFCRYAPLVRELGAKVILEVQRPLVKLLKNLEGVDEIIAEGDALPAFDYQCPLLSLPLAFKTELQNIPSVSQHIDSDSYEVEKWQAKLGEKAKPRVGLVWSGSTIHKNDHNRSLTLSKLLSYLNPNVEYVCLQKELRDIDKELLAQHIEIKYFGDGLEDFTDTAALCTLMDVVISVDTSVAHLAGTLGKPTWVLLPFIPDWRWLLDKDDNPWYPSAILYRQEKMGNWNSVLEKVKSDLEELVNNPLKITF